VGDHKYRAAGAVAYNALYGLYPFNPQASAGWLTAAT